MADYIGRLGESLSVYYCVDEWSLFSQMDEERTRQAERLLLERVDCVFAVNDALADAKRPFNAETHVAPHGVDREHFKQALSADTAVPADLAPLPAPVLGFYGAIADWVDVELLAQVARLRPDWTLALIGTELISTSALGKLPNVHLLGRRPYEALPAYCKGFDVALIPYLESDQLPYRNPIKLREYLAAGLPIVSTHVPEVEHYAAVLRAGRVGRGNGRGRGKRARERLPRAPRRALPLDRGRDLGGPCGRRGRHGGRARLQPPAGAGLMGAQPRFRAGMVGAGNICEYHVAAVQALPDVELVGITDLDQRRAEDAAAEWGTRAFPSIEALVDAGANVIHVLTPRRAPTWPSPWRRSSAAATCWWRSRWRRAPRTRAA